MNKKFTLGFSPCPNDTFIFDALVNKKIDTRGLDFDVILEDVQTLNQWAIQKKLDISKISYGVLPLVEKDYSLLSSGGALGKGVGPLLISKKKISAREINDLIIAIPGENTTAHLLFSLAFPQAKNKKFMLFSSIEEAVLKEEVNAGVIIHENRFTYREKGLQKIMDLGEYWEQKTHVPIPLGGIIIKKTIDPLVAEETDQLIRQSVEYAYEHHYTELTSYVKAHSQEMSEAVMRQHIDLYVNDYSKDLGPDGKTAVQTLRNVFKKINNVDETP